MSYDEPTLAQTFGGMLMDFFGPVVGFMTGIIDDLVDTMVRGWKTVRRHE